MDDLPFLHDLARDFAKDSPDVFLKAAINIASVDFFTVLNRFDTVDLNRRLNEKPELYFQLINSSANLMKASLEQQQFEHKQKQAEARQRERDQKLRARKPILITAITITSISSSVGRSIPADPHLGRASVPESHESAHGVPSRPRADGPPQNSVPSVPPVVNSSEQELAQIIAAEFASWPSREPNDSWEDHHHDEETQDALIGCPS